MQRHQYVTVMANHLLILMLSELVLADQPRNDEIDPIKTKINPDLLPSEDKVLSAVVNLQCGKAGGLDNIPPEIIKFYRPELVAKLTAYYAHCWDNSSIPSKASLF